MSFRSRELVKKIVQKAGGEKNLGPGVKESLKQYAPNTKVVMGRAQRGLFAGRHIQFGNQVSEKGGNASLSGRSDCSALLLVENKKREVITQKELPSPKGHLLPEAALGSLREYSRNSLCGDRSRRSWKPNVQEKRLFSYILDRHIRVKVTTHALRCIDKAGGIDEYLLKTPYKKMDTEMGLFWKAKIEKMYADLGEMEVCFFSPEDEAKFAEGFEELKIAKRAARREARRKMYGWSGKPEQIEEGKEDGEGTDEELVANS
ncbi:hypothetical protein RJ640_014994 [Escallonia rubra]|uniref:Large ribosomal subunit protein bL28m n=1 Tax=Escallonia rubra TaxID=112253 RepID=A0AA88S4G8_9ASTE|nr:hypothetical protein RJ640_014994 [Escallonia rubra]